MEARCQQDLQLESAACLDPCQADRWPGRTSGSRGEGHDRIDRDLNRVADRAGGAPGRNGSEPSLAATLERVGPGNRHVELDRGAPVGREFR